MTEPAEDLAARLRALKDRSGLSFGAMAPRLHVGTSTLHRYCAGEAVPLEFAIVDRFGRLCGATPDEMVALHRAWLLADAARTRGGETPTALPVGEPVEDPPLENASAEASQRPRRVRHLVAAVLAVVLLAAGGVALAGVFEDDGDSGQALQKGPPPSSNPLTMSVRTDVWEAGCDHSYLVDRPPAQVPEPPVEADAAAWAEPLAAVDAGRTIVEVTVAGTSAEPVVLQGLTVRMGEHREPLDWNVYAMSLGCGGALTPASYAVDLDQPRPVARAQSGKDGEQQLPALTFPFRVSSTEPVVLRVIATTKTCDCDWHLELAWTSGGSSGTTSITDGDRDFRTSGSTTKPYGYMDGWAR